MPQIQTQWPELSWTRLLTVGIAALLVLATLILLTACTVPSTFPIQGSQEQMPQRNELKPFRPFTSTSEAIRLSAGMLFFKSSITPTINDRQETYPVDEITRTKQLSNTTVISALSAHYSGTVHLEFALLHVGGNIVVNRWRLLYDPTNLPIQKPKAWYDYMQYSIPHPNLNRHPESTQILRGPPFGIVEWVPISSVVLTNSLPVTLIGWVNTLCPNDTNNSCKGSIARLAFSVESNGENHRVLYLSSHKEDGTLNEHPDGVDTCGSDRECSFYCCYISW